MNNTERNILMWIKRELNAQGFKVVTPTGRPSAHLRVKYPKSKQRMPPASLEMMIARGELKITAERFLTEQQTRPLWTRSFYDIFNVSTIPLADPDFLNKVIRVVKAHRVY